ncbi:MAG: helix-turn-helix domain-containing protein [Aquihabitans sp.]
MNDHTGQLSSDGPDGDLDPLGRRLLEAAVTEFAQRGYAGARVAEIARRAGVTTGAIYSRYRGKSDLLAEALDVATADEFDRLFTDHRFEGRMEDILRIAGSHLIAREESPDLIQASAPGLLLQAFASARQEVDVADLLHDRMLERFQRLEQVVEAAKVTGGIDPALDTTALVTFCYALGMGFLLLEVVDLPVPEQSSWDDLIGLLLEATGGRSNGEGSNRAG